MRLAPTSGIVHGPCGVTPVVYAFLALPLLPRGPLAVHMGIVPKPVVTQGSFVTSGILPPELVSIPILWRGRMV